MGIARQAILNVGEEFVEAGTITRSDDLVFLQLYELESLSRNKPHNWKALIADRPLPHKELGQIAKCLSLSLIQVTRIRRLQALSKRLPFRWFQTI